MSKWKILLLSQIESLGNYIWLDHDSNLSFRNKLNNFWKDVHSAWITLWHQNLDQRKEPIVYNQNINAVDNKTIFYPQWLIRGVSTLNDLIDKSGQFYTWEIFKLKYNFNDNNSSDTNRSSMPPQKHGKIIWAKKEKN
jgi:hypothetical protein